MESTGAEHSRTPFATAGWGRTWAWLPVILLFGSIAALWPLNQSRAYEPPFLLLILNLLFTTLTSAFVAFLVGRGFTLRGSPGLLLLGCGVAFWAIAGLVGVVAGHGSANLTVTIHNTCAWLSALCHLAGVGVSLGPHRRLRAPAAWLAATYTLIAGTVILITQSTLSGWMPLFFVQGAGGTPVRQVILGTASAMFLTTAALLGFGNRRSWSAFAFWYALALVATALGLFGVLIQPAFGSPLGWVGRTSQYLGGVYMVVAAVASAREARQLGVTLEEALREARLQYEALLELAADGFLVNELPTGGTGGRLVRVNPAICHLLGYSAQELLEMEPASILTPEDRPLVSGEADALSAGAVLRSEKTLVSKQGRRIPVEVTSRLHRSRGRLLVITTVRDITTRRQAEDMIRRQNAILDGLNRIFREALACQTEEQLGRACLSVAEGITGSKFGFIAEIGSGGRLESISISDPGWEACRIPQAPGRSGIAPGGFAIRGL